MGETGPARAFGAITTLEIDLHEVVPFVRRAAGVSNPRAARDCGTPFVPTRSEQHRAQGEPPRRGRSEAEKPALRD
jgi:hypothetical protein